MTNLQIPEIASEAWVKARLQLQRQMASQTIMLEQI
jgi:hypothetical protein